PAIVDTLRRAGAEVIDIPVYRWVPPDDPAPLHRLVETVAAAGIDAIAFTSAPAAASFLHAAGEKGCATEVVAALRGPVLAACVGPVTAHPLTSVDIPVISPARCRLGALVREIVEQVPARRGRTVSAAGHQLDIRGHAVILDGRLIPLTSTGAAVLHMLARRPGHVVTRGELLAIMPGDGGDEHAVEVAVGRLRTTLGDPRIIRTVVKRGYRIAE
ncbi:MAG TPA: uroporphyrinogen-III synthase, partial [Mycobacteriales bacterium]|nr:uroporphyrinogen-III synthase [Mycobacteriales bacterium]